MIEVCHLTKKYGERVAVKDISFTVEDGSVYGFLGPNGAGKTTTMNIMTGYLAATEGTVSINGHDIFLEAEEAKREIGYLPELPPLYPEMTPREYLKFAAELKKVPKEKREGAVDAALRETQVTDVENRLIRSLSKGYRQRVGLAGALVGDPRVLILDEPTVGLDPKQIIEMRELIKKLGKDRTVILSSHILSEVSSICDTVLILNNGSLVACDTPENLGRSLSGYKLDITFNGTRTAARKALADIKEIASLAFEKADGGERLIIAQKNTGDIRAEVSKALFSAGCAILSMKLETPSLEDVFLKLTEAEKEEDKVEGDI